MGDKTAKKRKRRRERESNQHIRWGIGNLHRVDLSPQGSLPLGVLVPLPLYLVAVLQGRIDGRRLSTAH